MQERDAEQVRMGSATFRLTCQVVRAAIAACAPLVLENPVAAMPWCAPPLLELCALARHKGSTDMCWR